MTVCIAAVADVITPDPKIILCTDWMVSGALGKSESMLKIKTMHKGWRLLTAGDEDEINAIAPKIGFAIRDADIVDETNIQSLIQGALPVRKVEKSNEITQNRFGLSYDRFIDIGKDKFPPEIFRDALLEIREDKFRAEFILAGFVGNFPTLIEVTSAGKVSIRENFATIGAGSFLAQTSLLYREHADTMKLSKAIYLVHEAKKYAEREVTVGQATIIVVTDKAGDQKIVSAPGKMWLDKEYDRLGPQNIGEATAPDDLFIPKAS